MIIDQLLQDKGWFGDAESQFISELFTGPNQLYLLASEDGSPKPHKETLTYAQIVGEDDAHTQDHSFPHYYLEWIMCDTGTMEKRKADNHTRFTLVGKQAIHAAICYHLLENLNTIPDLKITKQMTECFVIKQYYWWVFNGIRKQTPKLSLLKSEVQYLWTQFTKNKKKGLDLEEVRKACAIKSGHWYNSPRMATYYKFATLLNRQNYLRYQDEYDTEREQLEDYISQQLKSLKPQDKEDGFDWGELFA